MWRSERLSTGVGGVSSHWTVPSAPCACGKKGFEEHAIDKALGKAQAKRNRTFDKSGSRRGMVRESRFYECEESDLFHLTSMSRRVNQQQRWAVA